MPLLSKARSLFSLSVSINLNKDEVKDLVPDNSIKINGFALEISNMWNHVTALWNIFLWVFFFFGVCPPSEFWQDRVVVSYFSSFPPSAACSSPPISLLAVCGARRTAWTTWRCLGGITHDDTINAKASSRRTGHSEAQLDRLSTFDLESTCFAASSRHFSYLFLSADETQTSSSSSSSSSSQRVWMTSPPLILGARWL